MLWYAEGWFIKNRKQVVVTTDTLVAAEKVARVELIQEQLAFLGYQVQLTGQVLSNCSRPVLQSFQPEYMRLDMGTSDPTPLHFCTNVVQIAEHHVIGGYAVCLGGFVCIFKIKDIWKNWHCPNASHGLRVIVLWKLLFGTINVCGWVEVRQWRDSEICVWVIKWNVFLTEWGLKRNE